MCSDAVSSPHSEMNVTVVSASCTRMFCTLSLHTNIAAAIRSQAQTGTISRACPQTVRRAAVVRR